MIRNLTTLTAIFWLVACGQTWKLIDQDGDGFGPEEDCWDAPSGPEGSGLTGADIHPGATETWYDGVDQDCDGNDFDQDLDGYTSGEHGGADCDDADPAVNPDAQEVCGDADEDCDGRVDDDDDSLEPSAWYLDGDDDGYGGEQAVTQGCTPPDGYTTVGGDCDDGRSDIYPDAGELCDDIDQDCDGETRDDDSSDATAFYADADGDGFGDPDAPSRACDASEGYTDPDRAADCDDTDPAIHPDATEICDDADTDEDCNGVADSADPGATGAGTWYTDGDGDGYGAPATGEVRCDPDAGEVANDEDCDDDNGAINPGATEICNTTIADEDCDGQKDEADPSLDEATALSVYVDADADGHGSGPASLVCVLVSGYSETGDDCDDADADVYPGADEVCGDGVVNDCEGSEADAITACVLGDLDLADASSTLRGSAASYEVGAAMAGVGDYDADGTDDLAIGAPGVGSGDGRVYLVTGPVSTGRTTLGGSTALVVWSGSSAERLGTSVVGCDVDGDGTSDVAMGAPDYGAGSNSNGAVYLMVGPSTSATSSADLTLTGPTTTATIGTSLACGGDVDGDGRADLAVGAPGWSSSRGSVYVVAGDLTTGGDINTLDSAQLNGGSGTTDKVGTSLAFGPDVDGDGQQELIVGAPGEATGGTGAGAAYVVWGPPSATVSVSSDAVTLTGGSGSAAGTSVADAGDTNGDGYDDVLVGAPSYDTGATDRGAAYLILGDSSAAWSASLALSSADAVLSGAAAGDLAGTSVGGAGDMDDDGNDDVLVGAPGEDSGGSAAGAAFLLYAPISGAVSLSSADAVFTGESAGDAAGEAVGSAGDTDGDGRPEVLVGAPTYESSSGVEVGAVYLLSGGF